MTFQAAVLTMETSPVSELLEVSGNCRRILNQELNLHLLSDSLFSEQQKLKHVLDWAHSFISSGSDVHYELCRADSLILADEERREMHKITPPYKHSSAVSCTAGGKEMFGPFIDDSCIPFSFTPERQEYRKTPENMKSMELQDPTNKQTPSKENNCRTSGLFISNQRQHTNLSNRATNQTDGATCSIKASTSCWSDVESKLSYKTARAQSERDMSGRQMELSKVKVEGKVRTKNETEKEGTKDARVGKRKGTMNEDSCSAFAVYANNNMNSGEMEKTSNLSFSCHLKRPPTLTIYEQYQLCMDRLRVKQGQHIELGCFIESPAEERKTSEETAAQNPAIKKHRKKAGSKRVTAAEITKKRSSGVFNKKQDRSQCSRSRETEHRQIKHHDNLTVKETPAAIYAERNTVSSNTHLVLDNKCSELKKRTAGGITSADNVINTPMEHLGTTPGAALTSNPGLFPERIRRNPGVNSCQCGVKGQKTKAGGQGALLSLCEKSSVSPSSPTNKEILQRPRSSGVKKHTKRHTPEDKAKPSSACRHKHTPLHDDHGPTSSISSLFPERNRCNTDGNGCQSGVRGQTTKARGEGASSSLCEKSSVSLSSPTNKEIQRRHQSSGVNKHTKILTPEDKVKPSSACKHTHKCVPPSETHTPLYDDPGPTSSAPGAYRCKQADKHSPAGVPERERWLCLPDEVWLSILSLLPLSDLCRVLQVCSRLHTLAADHTLWRNVRIENCNLTERWLLCVGRRRPRSLCLYSCTDLSLTSDGLEMFITLCRDFLEELKVTSCTGPVLHGDQMLPLIGQLCHHVTSVDVSWSRATDKGVKALSDCCPGLRLKSVVLNGCHVTDDPLMKLVMRHKESLCRLEVFGCQFLTPSCLQTVYEMCPGLRHLNIGQVPKVNTHSLTVMTSQLKCLISLNLAGLQAVSDATVDTLLQNCVELQSLTVSSCPGVTDLTLHSVRKYTPCLRSLDVRGCKAVTDAGVQSLALGCRRLEQLDLSSTGTRNRGVTLLANYCSGHLHTVKLSFCHITSENILKLCRRCKRLKVLHLYGCAHLPTERQIREVNATVKVYPPTLT